MDCSCARCQRFCHIKPGWFTPDQVAPLAASLDITVEALFQRYLTIDVVLAGSTEIASPIFVLAPAMAESGPGVIADPKAKGTCVWLQGGKCSIHALKPRECAIVDHTTSPQTSNMLRAAIVKQWLPLTGLVQQLYGAAIAVPEALKAEYERVLGETRACSSPPQTNGTDTEAEPLI